MSTSDPQNSSESSWLKKLWALAEGHSGEGAALDLLKDSREQGMDWAAATCETGSMRVWDVVIAKGWPEVVSWLAHIGCALHPAGTLAKSASHVVRPPLWPLGQSTSIFLDAIGFARRGDLGWEPLQAQAAIACRLLAAGADPTAADPHSGHSTLSEWGGALQDWARDGGWGSEADSLMHDICNALLIRTRAVRSELPSDADVETVVPELSLFAPWVARARAEALTCRLSAASPSVKTRRL